MRITERQRKVIVDSVQEVFGANSSVRLFGSRADDAKRGGDFDLYVELDGVEPLKERKSSALAAKIICALGYEVPIDVIVKDDTTKLGLIHSEGKMGIVL